MRRPGTELEFDSPVFSRGSNIPRASSVDMSHPIHLRTTYVKEGGTPSWAKWLYTQDGDGNVETDADGAYPAGSEPKFMIDLSKMMSEMLGKQCPQMATYRLEYLTIQLQNVDDTNDNNTGAVFGGYCDYLEPTARRIDALQLARKVEKATEEADIDSNSHFLRTDNDYTGFRFNLTSDDQIHHATTEPFTTLSGSQWDAQEIFQVYEEMKGTELTAAQPDNALWKEALWDRCGSYSSFGFEVGFINSNIDHVIGVSDIGLWTGTSNPTGGMWKLDLPSGTHLPVLGGMLLFTLNRSNSIEPVNVASVPPNARDEWEFRITAGVSGWSGF